VFSLLSLLDSKLPILLPSFPVLHDFYMRFGARCVPPRDRRHESRCRRIDAPRSWHAGRRCDSASATEHGRLFTGWRGGRRCGGRGCVIHTAEDRARRRALLSCSLENGVEVVGRVAHVRDADALGESQLTRVQERQELDLQRLRAPTPPDVSEQMVELQRQARSCAHTHLLL
jgi:hypothetical protein